MVNICTDFNFSNKTYHITNINKMIPFIYITSPASSKISQCNTMCLTAVCSMSQNYTKKSGMQPPNLYILRYFYLTGFLNRGTLYTAVQVRPEIYTVQAETGEKPQGSKIRQVGLVAKKD